MASLLPNRYKIISISVLMIIILGMITIKLIYPDFIDKNRSLLKPLLKSILVLGLLILILSKEKLEDEFINHCRLRAFKFAFLCSAISGVFCIFGVGESILDSYGFQVICTQLLSYLFFFSIIKSSLFNSAK